MPPAMLQERVLEGKRRESFSRDTLYLKRVRFSSMELQITVAMASNFVSDPTRDLLELIETLLPQVIAM